MWLHLIILFFSIILIDGKEDYPKVRTFLGDIRGYYKTSDSAKLYEAYEGIPYANPPIGKLRFQAPERISSWPGELQATKLSDACLQYSHIPTFENERVEGSEDCLYLNVYAPVREKSSRLLPVIIWIHGGCFQYGAGTVFGAKYLIDKDIIVVTINYRLGALGFLSTEDDIVPGNMGLKDQSMALRWVHENIEAFGGNPNKITLTGLSAGGASVHYHYLSPLSNGLFQNGISFSGNALLCWAQTENALEKAKKLGALMGCPTSSTREMVLCLRHRPAKPIVQATSEFMPWLYNPYTPFGPVVENVEKDYFINKSPAEIIASGEVQDVPWITGVVSEEGLYPVAEFAANSQHLKHLNDNWDSVATYLLDYNYTLPKEKHAEIAQKIKKHYYGSKPIERSNVKPLTLMVGDRLFIYDAVKAAKMQAKSNKEPVWFFYYSYRAAQSLSDVMSGTKDNFGVCHADDAYLVIEQPFVNPTTTKEDRAMQKDLLNLWASVAIEGTPDVGVKWPVIKKKEFKYLHISGPGKFAIEIDDNLGEYKFWNSIDFNENKPEKLSSNKVEL